jgi:GNAT superfamily N-acetyltransferase
MGKTLATKIIAVRPAEPRDFHALWSLLQEMGSTDEQRCVLRRLEQFSRSESHLLAVALVDGKAVGYAWVQDYGPHLRDGKSTARPHDLFVQSTARRLGAGTELLNAVIAWARERGVTWLQWQASQAGTAFYERFGLTGDPCPDPTHPFFEIQF